MSHTVNTVTRLAIMERVIRPGVRYWMIFLQTKDCGTVNLISSYDPTVQIVSISFFPPNL